jgi:drug/metabolite transporter (DMT)-like permease
MMLIQEIGPVRASVVTYLLPPIGVFLGWLVLDEGIGWNLVGGLACVVAGVALVQGIPAGRLLRRGIGRASAETAPAAAPAD